MWNSFCKLCFFAFVDSCQSYIKKKCRLRKIKGVIPFALNTQVVCHVTITDVNTYTLSVLCKIYSHIGKFYILANMHTYCIIASMLREHNKTIIIYMKQIEDTQYKGKSCEKKSKSKIIFYCFLVTNMARRRYTSFSRSRYSVRVHPWSF